uniref:THAP domain-containing protein 1 n=1 Tax=Poecilia latipinna TaxID=48699 RepID=A0A3B3V3R5_9TELE
MVVYCWVKGCKNRGDKKVKRSFHYIPKRRRVWLTNIRRKDQPSSTSRICSDHFISGKDIFKLFLKITILSMLSVSIKLVAVEKLYFVGKPADLYDRSNPDWAPTLKLTKEATLEEIEFRRRLSEANLKRYMICFCNQIITMMGERRLTRRSPGVVVGVSPRSLADC